MLTVFAGTPAGAAERQTDWDRRCGHADAAAALAARCREDDRALALLGAKAERLDFVDEQYEGVLEEVALHAALHAALVTRDEALVLVPLGLFHADHHRVYRVGRAVLEQLGRPCLVYEDAIYRAMPGLLDARWRELAAAGSGATRFDLPEGSAQRKAEAVAAYSSQLGPFSAAALADLHQPERFWRLEWPSR